MGGDDEQKPLLGLAAAATAVAIWSGWIIATRMAMVDAVDPLVVAFCRNVVPPLVLLPVILRRGIVPRGAPVSAVLMMAFGWGVPFIMLAGTGLQTVPASLFAPLTPGTTPIMVALISAGLLGARLRPEVIVGLVLVALALALILGEWVLSAELAALGGAPWLLAAALAFSIYTVNFRRSGLSPVEATAYVGLWSLPLVLPLWLLRPDTFAGLDASDWALQLTVQGVLAGIVGAIAYPLAIRHLGTVRGSMTNALMPVTAALAGVLLLGEQLRTAEWVAIVLASLGVAAANGAFRRRRPRTTG